MHQNDNTEEESHRLLPSGQWVGFYCYNTSAQQHKMQSHLTFANGRVSGSGVDDISQFTWSGNYNIQDFKTTITKSYSTHTVTYRGDIDENGIWEI